MTCIWSVQGQCQDDIYNVTTRVFSYGPGHSHLEHDNVKMTWELQSFILQVKDDIRDNI